jgi:exodeoxyribonuclease V beta subunit
MSGVTTFAVDAPIGPRTLVEASAGTGKTHALSGLAVQLIATGEVTTDQLLVVTFTRLAAAELRDRIRSRLLATRAALRDGVPHDDLSESLLARADPAVEANLARGLLAYDELAVSTFHAYAQRTLTALGSRANVDPDAGILTDQRELLAEVSADVLAIAAQQAQAELGDDWRSGLGVLPTLSTLVKIATQRTDLPDLLLDPAHDTPALRAASSAAMLAHLAEQATESGALRRRRAGLRNYAEVLADLRDVLFGADGRSLAEQVRGRLRVALIDEFQDTDRLQWDIFDRAFGRDVAKLVLVGDPKQAIYRFRGADVGTYVRVANGDVARQVLGTNWRSDGPLLRGLDTLFDGVTFGEGIAFTAVAAAPDHQHTRLRRDDGATIAPVELAFIDDPELRKKGPDGHPLRAKPGKGEARGRLKEVAEPVATDAVHGHLVAHLVDLIEHGRLTERDVADDRSDDLPDDRPIRPDDVAVLVRSNAAATAVAAVLADAGIPAVIRSDDDVRRGEGAQQWRALLEALARPTDARRVRAAAVGVFGPLDAPAALLTVSDEVLAEYQDRITGWAAALARLGPAELVGRVRSESGMIARVLARDDGDRLMTDLDHLGELFGVLVGTGPASPEQLIAALRVEPDDQAEEQITSRRVESDDPAVTIMTIHKSKGLEFGVVCAVGLHKSAPAKEVMYHDDERDRRVRDLRSAKECKGSPGAVRSAREDREDAMRLLYVALTRARHHVFLSWVHEQNSPRASLTRVLFARDPDDGRIDPEALSAESFDLAEPEDALALLEQLAVRSDGTVSVRHVGRAPATRWGGPSSDGSATAGSVDGLGVARLDRVLDRRAHRWSFTAITARAEHDAFAGSSDVAAEPRPGDDEGTLVTDDARERVDASSDSTVADGAVSPLAGLPAGASFGTLVHALLEQVDFADPDLSTTLSTLLDAELAWRPLDLAPLDATGPRDLPRQEAGRRSLVDGLVAAIESPLGPAFDGGRLRDLTWQDRLSEANFELRLDTIAGAVSDATIGALVLEHLSDDDPHRPWAETLAAGRFHAELAGHLNGSLDLVARVRGASGLRFVIVDYKTNRLHVPGRVPAPDDYGPVRMVAEMARHHYPLQALLYSVALHRYLRWRMPDYRPDVHLGGAAYLFVRGMAGPSTRLDGDDPQGVCRWAIPPALIEALDAAFAGRGDRR